MFNVRVLWVGENILGFQFENEVFNSDQDLRQRSRRLGLCWLVLCKSSHRLKPTKEGGDEVYRRPTGPVYGWRPPRTRTKAEPRISRITNLD